MRLSSSFLFATLAAFVDGLGENSLVLTASSRAALVGEAMTGVAT